jgi:ATP-dependent Clp protease ATP-binding subunit ClpC
MVTEHLLFGLIQDRESIAVKVLQNLDIDSAQIQSRLIKILEELVTIPAGEVPDVQPNRPQGKALEEFGTDLTQLAATGKIDPVIGRQQEIERVTQILGRRTKNNPVLIGEPGVGKTAIAGNHSRG